MDQNLSYYRIFYTVAKYQNISHAASELYISQPAISKAITKLESNMNVTLFHRNSRGVTLTEEGQILYQHLGDAFTSITQAENAIKKIKTLGIGKLRIGVSTTLCKYILLPYLKEFVSLYPHIKIIIECHSTFQTLELLEKGEIDIGLIGKPDQRKDILFHPVQTIQDGFVATKSYIDNLILRENCSPDEIFQRANVMLLDEKNISRNYIDTYFETHLIKPKQLLEVSNMDLLIEFAKIGLGVACVIKDFVQSELTNGTLTEIILPAIVKPREIGFAISKQFPITGSLQNFIDFYEKKDTI